MVSVVDDFKVRLAELHAKLEEIKTEAQVLEAQADDRLKGRGKIVSLFVSLS